jgi:hypothetical protein
MFVLASIFNVWRNKRPIISVYDSPLDLLSLEQFKFEQLSGRVYYQRRSCKAPCRIRATANVHSSPSGQRLHLMYPVAIPHPGRTGSPEEKLI